MIALDKQSHAWAGLAIMLAGLTMFQFILTAQIGELVNILTTAF